MRHDRDSNRVGLHFRLRAIADEAETVWRRLAFSPCLADDGETSAVVAGPDGAGRHVVWAEGERSNPFLAALLGEWLASASLSFEPGVTLLSNDPFEGGGTTADVRMALAVPLDGTDVVILASSGHYLDLGGRQAGGICPTAEEVLQEGLRIGPVAIAREGKLLDAPVRVIGANCRFPSRVLADLQAQVDGLSAAGRRLKALLDSAGPKRLRAAAEDVGRTTRSAAEAALSEFEAGVYLSRDRLDGCGGGPLRLKIEAVVRNGRIGISFDGTSGPSSGPMNCPAAATRAACLTGLRQLLPEVARHGVLRQLVRVDIPSPCLLDARFPSAVGGSTPETVARVADAVVAALSQAVHGRGAASGGGGSPVLVLEDRRASSVMRLVLGGGGGASSRGDGLVHADSGARYTVFPSIEALERTFPVRVTDYARRGGSGGAGRYRGGDGAVLELSIRRAPLFLTLLHDRGLRGASGRHRGNRGTTAAVSIFTDGRWSRIPPGTPISRVELAEGDRVRLETAGGGGYGHPYERALRLVARDVQAGILDRRSAALEHGVVFGRRPDGQGDPPSAIHLLDYDSAATFKLRSYRLTLADVESIVDEIDEMEP